MTLEDIRHLVLEQTAHDPRNPIRIRQVVDAKTIYVGLCIENNLDTNTNIGKSIGCTHGNITHLSRQFDNKMSNGNEFNFQMNVKFIREAIESLKVFIMNVDNKELK